MTCRRITQFFRTVFLIVVYTTTMISSCQVPTISQITGITPTPLTPSPTPRICPPNIDLTSLDSLEIDPTFIVILYDPNSLHEGLLEYTTGEKTSDLMGFVSHILSTMLGPGDQYSIFSLGFRSYEAAKLDRYNSKISNAPEIVDTPHPHETLTPISTPTRSDAVLENQKSKNEYEAAVEAQNATATQSAFEYYCEVMAYDATYKVTATAWSVTKHAEAAEIATQITIAQAGREERILTTETPFAPNNVYEGLSHVTVDFESQCKNYDRCILLIFDDLTDWRSETPDYLYINLENVEIISVVAQCEDIIQPSCVTIQEKWTPLFDSYKAKSIVYFNGERLEESLLMYLGGK